MCVSASSATRRTASACSGCGEKKACGSRPAPEAPPTRPAPRHPPRARRHRSTDHPADGPATPDPQRARHRRAAADHHPPTRLTRPPRAATARPLRGLRRVGPRRTSAQSPRNPLYKRAPIASVCPSTAEAGDRADHRNEKSPAERGFPDAPKRTRTSTRLSRTRPSTLPVKPSGGAGARCRAISRPAAERFGPYLTPRRVSRRVSRNR
jgi:hypothetical protein